MLRTHWIEGHIVQKDLGEGQDRRISQRTLWTEGSHKGHFGQKDLTKGTLDRRISQRALWTEGYFGQKDLMKNTLDRRIW